MLATQTKPTTDSGLWLIALVALIAVALLARPDAGLHTQSLEVPGAGAVQLRLHAVERHGTDAEWARGVIASAPNPYRWRCPDRDVEYVAAQGSTRNEWAFMVVGATSRREVTAFRTSWRYILKMVDRDRCRAEFPTYAH